MRIEDRRRVNQRCHGYLRQARATAHTLLTVHPVARRRLEPGVTVWAHIPFQDRPEWKLRPALVVGLAGRTVLVRPITGSITRLHHDRYLEVEDLVPAGLERPCAISLRRVVELDLIEVVSLIGRLSDVDYLRLQVAEALIPFLSMPSVSRIR